MLSVPNLLSLRSAEIYGPQFTGFLKLAAPSPLESKLMHDFDPWRPERFGPITLVTYGHGPVGPYLSPYWRMNSILLLSHTRHTIPCKGGASA